MNKQEEIELRQKLIYMLDDYREVGELHGHFAEGLRKAAELIGESIVHDGVCPCKDCRNWVIKTSADRSEHHRRIRNNEIEQFIESMEAHRYDVFECGYCNGCQNEWSAFELIYDSENEFALTPCCHTEATEALHIAGRNGEPSQLREDRREYWRAVTGR